MYDRLSRSEYLSRSRSAFPLHWWYQAVVVQGSLDDEFRSCQKEIQIMLDISRTGGWLEVAFMWCNNGGPHMEHKAYMQNSENATGSIHRETYLHIIRSSMPPELSDSP